MTNNLTEMTLEELLALKDVTKKTVVNFGGKSQSYKILINAGYGALANIWMRWFSNVVAESITLSGQMSIKWVEKSVNEFLNRVLGTTDVDYVVAIDTDSIYVRLDEVVDHVFKGKEPTEDEIVTFLEKFSDKLQDNIQNSLEGLYKSTNAFDKKLFMAIEAIGPAIWVAKKRYVMSLPSYKKVRYNPPKIKIQGIDAVRSSTPAICREYIKKCIPLLIEGDRRKVREYIDACRADFMQHPYEDVAFPRGTNELEKYMDAAKIYGKKCPPHVRGALLYNHLLKEMKLTNKLPTIKSGDKVRFCYMKLPNPLMENIFAAPDTLPSELGMDDFIDYSKQFEKSFFIPLKKIIDAAEIDLNDAIDISQFLTGVMKSYKPEKEDFDEDDEFLYEEGTEEDDVYELYG